MKKLSITAGLDPFNVIQPSPQPGDAPPMRRLFHVLYHCGLCRQRHIAEYYMSSFAHSPKELELTINQLLTGTEEGEELAHSMAKLHHAQRGDIERLERRRQQGTRPNSRILTLEVTEEEDYTCDHCGMKFETIGSLRRHRGRNIRSNLPLPPEQRPANACAWK